MHNLKYHDRDLSWLSFNERILMEGKNHRLPLFERIKFLAIYSSNLDEFYRVRIPALLSLNELVDSVDGIIDEELKIHPSDVLQEINIRIREQQSEFGRIITEELRPELYNEGIHIYVAGEELHEIHRSYCEYYFKSRVLSYLQPVFIRKKRNAFLSNRTLYLIVELESKEANSTELAYVNIPSENLPRFIQLPPIDGIFYTIFLDDLIRVNLKRIFVGFEIVGCYSVKLNRNADLLIGDEFSGDLVEKIRTHLANRLDGVPSRFLYDKTMPAKILKTVKKKFKLKGSEMVEGGMYHSFFDMFGLKNPKSPQLELADLIPVKHPLLESSYSIFEAFRDQDILLHFPYQSYDYVLMFFNEAAIDPRVKEIQVTFYRVAASSFITNALISAARNGKKVKAFVELKARFDEENNLRWAARMEEAGVKITYSIPGLKVHAKTALVKREDEDGVLRNYAYLGTGNFNEKTASVYSDLGLFTTHTGITQELDSVFKFLYRRKPIARLEYLLVSQFNIVDEFKSKVDREIANARQGKKAEITIKINNIDDPAMIDKLYEASRAGVKINFIIRGICCLVPSQVGLSENIHARRIVGRFLEHSRIFIFHNGGNPEYYSGSADWMMRNLYRRIEVIFPILDHGLQREVQTFIDFQLKDNCTAAILDNELKNHVLAEANDQEQIRAQEGFYEWIMEKSMQKANSIIE